MKIIYLLLDAISYEDSWLNEHSKMKHLKNLSKNSLNFHNHYSDYTQYYWECRCFIKWFKPNINSCNWKSSRF